MNAHNGPGSAQALLRQTQWLQALAATLVSDANEAEDLAQDTWLRALRRPPPDSWDEPRLRSFLATVARNLALSHWRTRTRRSAREQAAARAEAMPSTAEVLERVHFQRELVDAVLALEASERDVVLLRYFESLPPREIAERLGLSNDAVRSRLKRALQHLRARLDRRFDGRAAWIGLGLGLRSGAAGQAALSLGAGKPLVVALAVVLLSFLVAVAGRFVQRSPPGPTADLTLSPIQPAREAHVDTTENQAAPLERSAVATPAESAAIGEARNAPAASVVLLARTVDAQRAPIAGVRIEVVDAAPELFAHSDTQGRVRLELPWPYRGRTVGRGELELRATAHALATRRWYAPLAGPGERSLGELVLVPGGEVLGRVVDERRQPVAGAWVAAFAAPAPSSPRELELARVFGTHLNALSDDLLEGARTGPDGSFVLGGVPAARACIAARTVGRLAAISAALDVPIGASIDAGELVVEAPSDAQRIAGRVHDELGAPLVGLAIGIEASASAREQARASTDRDGRFELIVASAGAYDLTVSRERSSDAALVVRQVVAGTLDLDVTLASPRSIEVVVLASDGTPLRDCDVFLTSEQGYRLRAETTRLRDGVLSFSSPTGNFVVHAIAKGWRPATQGPFDVSSAPARLEFALSRASGIRGRVSAAGAPVAGASVHVHAVLEPGAAQISDEGFHSSVDAQVMSAVSTDSEGRFFIPLHANSSWVVHVEHPGYARTASAPIDYVDGLDVACAELELVVGGAIEGRVLVAEGVDVRGTLVGVSGGDGHVQALEVGADGAFRFEHLAAGPWQVRRCDAETFERTQSGMFVDADSAQAPEWDVEVRNGETSRFELDLRHRVPSSLAGSLCLGTRSLEGWRASLAADGVVLRASLTTSGEFRIDSPTSGDFELALHAPRASNSRARISQKVTLAPGANSWALALDIGSVRITGLPRVAVDLAHEREPYSLRWLGPNGLEWRAELSGADGQPVTIPAVPAGRVELVESAGERVVSAFEVLAGVEADLMVP